MNDWGCNVKCRCGHVADMGQFVERPIGGPLPAGQYQCPACGFSWRIDHMERQTAIGPEGFIFQQTRIIPIDPAL